MGFFKLLLKAIFRSSQKDSTRLLNYFVQYIFGVNKKFSHPIHYTSIVTSPENIKTVYSANLLRSFEFSGCCYFSAPNGIHFGKDVLFAPHLKIISANHAFSGDRDRVVNRPVVIDHNVWIGCGVTILPGVRIGEHAVVGAGSVVTKDVERFSVVAGVPAVKIGGICEKCFGKMLNIGGQTICKKCLG